MCRETIRNTWYMRFVSFVAWALIFLLSHRQLRAQSEVYNVRDPGEVSHESNWVFDNLFPDAVLASAATEPAATNAAETVPLEARLASTSRAQPQQPILTRPSFTTSIEMPSAARERTLDLFGATSFVQSEMGRDLFARSRAPSTDIISGVEAKARATTDVGSLLGKSPTSLGTAVQKRTPIVSDPRVRGSRIGQLAASGSHWVPARIDLDTPVNKIDSRLINNVSVIGGPYSVLYGPGLDFVDIELIQSPRFQNGFEGHGTTGFDFSANGDQWSGLQRLWGGGSDWGFAASYGHRTGNDYRAGSGVDIASSYNSRDVFVTLGKDLCEDDSVEFSFLRLDQTGVEFPGYVFDMDYLVADAFELGYEIRNKPLFDRLDLQTWYNSTRFRGDSQNPSKRQEFPILDFLGYEGYTQADTMSTGFTVASTWGMVGDPQLTAGTDLRFVRQNLDEVALCPCKSKVIIRRFQNLRQSTLGCFLHPYCQWEND